jgi:hypothetical protein
MRVSVYIRCVSVGSIDRLVGWWGAVDQATSLLRVDSLNGSIVQSDEVGAVYARATNPSSLPPPFLECSTRCWTKPASGT